MNRVVVTGMGIVSPLGCSVSHNWSSLISGISGAGKISLFDSENYKCKVACEVPLGDGTNGLLMQNNGSQKKILKNMMSSFNFL